jgi:hypothetical protein
MLELNHKNKLCKLHMLYLQLMFDIKGWAKKYQLFYFLKLLKIETHWVIIKNAQQKMYFAYSFFNCWNSGFPNFNLPNLIFKNK